MLTCESTTEMAILPQMEGIMITFVLDFNNPMKQ